MLFSVPTDGQLVALALYFRPCDVASHVIESRDTRPHIQIVYRFSEAYTQVHRHKSSND